MSDSNIQQFMDFTGADSDTATQFLLMCNDNVETAIQIFLESVAGDASPHPPPPPQPTTKPPPSSATNFFNNNNSTKPTSQNIQKFPENLTDEDLAAFHAAGAFDENHFEESNVRPAIDSTFDTLDPSWGDPSLISGFNPLQGISFPSANVNNNNVADNNNNNNNNNDFTTTTTRRTTTTTMRGGMRTTTTTTATNRNRIDHSGFGFGGEMGGMGGMGRGGGGEANFGAFGLMEDTAMVGNEMFPLKPDMLFQGTFDEAKVIAKQRGKPVLVNVQDYRNFSCQTLNRDVLSAPFTRELIMQNFVFLQIHSASEEGQRFRTFYPGCDIFPFFGVIDSRTGALLDSLSSTKQIDADDLNSKLLEWAEMHTHKPAPQPQPTPNTTTTTSNTNTTSNTTPNTNTTSNTTSYSNATNSTTNATTPSATNAMASVATEDSIPLQTVQISEQPVRPPRTIHVVDEPDTTSSGNNNVTTIKLKMPDGSQITRRFLASHTIQNLLDFAYSVVGDNEDLELKQTFPIVVFDQPEQTLQEANLCPRGLVVVEKASRD